jgi:hypothetical protein
MTVGIRFSNGIVRSRSFAISPRIRASFASEHPALKTEGAGNAGAPTAPAAACGV